MTVRETNHKEGGTSRGDEVCVSIFVEKKNSHTLKLMRLEKEEERLWQRRYFGNNKKPNGHTLIKNIICT